MYDERQDRGDFFTELLYIEGVENEEENISTIAAMLEYGGSLNILGVVEETNRPPDEVAESFKDLQRQGIIFDPDPTNEKYVVVNSLSQLLEYEKKRKVIDDMLARAEHHLETDYEKVMRSLGRKSKFWEFYAPSQILRDGEKASSALSDLLSEGFVERRDSSYRLNLDEVIKSIKLVNSGDNRRPQLPKRDQIRRYVRNSDDPTKESAIERVNFSEERARKTISEMKSDGELDVNNGTLLLPKKRV